MLVFDVSLIRGQHRACLQKLYHTRVSTARYNKTSASLGRAFTDSLQPAACGWTYVGCMLYRTVFTSELGLAYQHSQ